MRRFAKPLYGLTPVPRVRIPPSPTCLFFTIIYAQALLVPRSASKALKPPDYHEIVILLLNTAARRLFRMLVPRIVLTSQILQLIDRILLVFVDGAGVGAENAGAGVPDDLRHEYRRYPCSAQP